MTQYERALQDAEKELGHSPADVLELVRDNIKIHHRAAELLAMRYQKWCDENDWMSDFFSGKMVQVTDNGSEDEPITREELFNQFNNS